MRLSRVYDFQYFVPDLPPVFYFVFDAENELYY